MPASGVRWQKGRDMEKIRLKDGTEIEIQEGASLGEITVHESNFEALEGIGNILLTEGNLDEVTFISNDEVTGEYTDLKVERPLFHSVDMYIEEKEVVAVFSLREKEQIEKDVEEIKSGQVTQDRAIEDLGEAVSTIAERGEV